MPAAAITKWAKRILAIAATAILGVLTGLLWRAGAGDVLTANKDAWATIQAIITVLGVPAGLGWWMFQRQRYPRADLAVTVTHRYILPGVIWLRVRAALANKGSVIVCLEDGELLVQQVVPPPEPVRQALEQHQNPVPDGQTEVPWNYLCRSTTIPRSEIEPGETDVSEWDFFVRDPEVKTVAVYVHFTNVAKPGRRRIGWSDTVIHDLTPVIEPSVKPLDGRQTDGQVSSSRVVAKV